MMYLIEDIVNLQRSVFQKLLKKIGTTLLSGKSVMNVSLPVCLFSNKSIIQKCANSVRCIPDLIEELRKQPDPIKRIARTMGYLNAYQN